MPEPLVFARALHSPRLARAGRLGTPAAGVSPRLPPVGRIFGFLDPEAPSFRCSPSSRCFLRNGAEKGNSVILHIWKCLYFIHRRLKVWLGVEFWKSSSFRIKKKLLSGLTLVNNIKFRVLRNFEAVAVVWPLALLPDLSLPPTFVGPSSPGAQLSRRAPSSAALFRSWKISRIIYFFDVPSPLRFTLLPF